MRRRSLRPLLRSLQASGAASGTDENWVKKSARKWQDSPSGGPKREGSRPVHHPDRFLVNFTVMSRMLQAVSRATRLR